MGFSRQEYWLSGWPHPPPGNLPNPGIESTCYISCTGRWLLYHQSCLGSPHSLTYLYNFKWTTQFSSFSLGTHFMTMNTHYPGLLVQKSQLADSPNCCSTGSTMHSPACEQAWQRCSRYQGSLLWERQDSSNCWLWRDNAPSARTNCTIYSPKRFFSSLPSISFLHSLLPQMPNPQHHLKALPAFSFSLPHKSHVCFILASGSWWTWTKASVIRMVQKTGRKVKIWGADLPTAQQGNPLQYSCLENLHG